VLVRRAYAGINASDINYTSGRYHSSKAEAERQLPFDAGFETVGVVAAVGEGVTGQPLPMAWKVAGW
jgi:NADPH:quinone reductase-like Zn-dependent oxidoreductase